MRLENKVAIVTGASSGLGEAIAKMFLKEGAKVVLSDINEYANLESLGENALLFKADVSKKEEVENLVNFAVEKFNTLDVMVNNAGIAVGSSIFDLEEDLWQKTIDINLKGVMLGTKFAAKYMRENNIKGSIINISSIAGSIGFQNSVAYCSSKGGVSQLTKAAGVELAPYGIRVNAIAPGYIKTNMTKFVYEDEAVNKEIEKSTPAGKMGEPDDIAYGAVYLAGEESKFVIGSTLFIDGGFTAQ